MHASTDSEMKLKERLVVGILSALVFLTIVLVLNIEMVQVTQKDGGSPSGLGFLENLVSPGAQSGAMVAFRKRVLQKSLNGSREASDPKSGAGAHPPVLGSPIDPVMNEVASVDPVVTEDFGDLVNLLVVKGAVDRKLRTVKFTKKKKPNPTVSEVLGFKARSVLSLSLFVIQDSTRTTSSNSLS